MGPSFFGYVKGMFNGRCGDEPDHGVAAVAYGSSKGIDYFRVKNSRGTRMKREILDGLHEFHGLHNLGP
ncbi:hypothetical protein DY000_02064076 [Brassica cretica]|uniref:Peptidase C1A papain C-terminal domain-containing protein n=1 Tax=Brassica cretica TaxID=69181 RepID=A0ABQ7ASN0_BRACR|nr:hypothetical protein DY000_02064076 [Brassica cretica]